MQLSKSTRRIASAVALAVGMTMVAAPASADSPNVAHCADLDASYKTLKFDGQPYVGQIIQNDDLTITVTAVETKDGGTEVVGFYWTSSDPGPQAVIIKGSNAVKIYPSVNGRTESLWFMYAPTKGPLGSKSKHYGVSYIEFCY